VGLPELYQGKRTPQEGELRFTYQAFNAERRGYENWEAAISPLLMVDNQQF
jgi:hypothetical protein